MYDVQDVAEYVITYSEVKDYGISNLKLQKILYLILAYSLIHTKKPCFSEFFATAIITLSKISAPFFKISICPLVIGSKLPG